MAVVSVSIHSDLSEFPTEKRYDSSIKISDLKKKLELITGANHTTMKLTLSTCDEDETKALDNDDETLSHYLGDKAGNKDLIVKLIVKDDLAKDLLSGDVPKFTISEEEYQARQNNARNFIKEQREKVLSNQSS